MAQAALVWSLGDASGEAIDEFIRSGVLPSGKSGRARFSLELRAAVDQKIDEIVANGGKLIVKPE